jgi:hypothetical protein
MRHLLSTFSIALLLSACGPLYGDTFDPDTTDIDFGARNAAWDSDPCAEYSPQDGMSADELKVQCSGMTEEWSFEDMCPTSPTLGQGIGPSNLGKASLFAYYWANCGTCEQQTAYLQVLQDTLDAEGFDVQIVSIAYNGSGVGALGASPRDDFGACGRGADMPSCTAAGEITLTIPVVRESGGIGTAHGVDRGYWYIYRADGKLFEFIDSEARPEQSGFLGNGANWSFLKDKLKEAAMATIGETEPCSDSHACSYPDQQWCLVPDGQCGGQGHCVTSDMPLLTNSAMATVRPVCNGQEINVPVCTCDRQEYASRCHAEVDKKNVLREGLCDH